MLVRVFDLTDEQKEAFIEGWKKAGGYVDAPDSPYPWCRPWEWTDEIEVEGDTLEEMGADWWRRSWVEIEALIEAWTTEVIEARVAAARAAAARAAADE